MPCHYRPRVTSTPICLSSPTSRISLTKTSQGTVGIQKFQWKSQQNYTLKNHLFISFLIIRSSWYCVILYSAKTAGKVDIGGPVFYSYNSSFSYHTIPGFYSHLVIFFTDGNNLYYLNKFCINENKWSYAFYYLWQEKLAHFFCLKAFLMDCNGSFHSHAVLHQSSKYMNQCLPQFWSYKQEQRSAKNRHFTMERAIRKRCRKQTAADRNILTKWLSIDLWIDPILLKAQVT